MDWTTIISIFNAVFAVVTAIFAVYWARLLRFRTDIPLSRLARVQAQLQILYGPVLGCLLTHEASWQAFRRTHAVPEFHLFKKYYEEKLCINPNEVHQSSKAFLTHVRLIYLPLLKKASSIVQSNVHLLFEETGIPAKYVNMMQSVAVLDASHQRCLGSRASRMPSPM